MRSLKTIGRTCAPVLALVIVLSGLQLGAQSVGYLRTKIDPHVAGVIVDGKYRGTAAMFGHRSRMLELTPGEHDVEIIDPRYRTLKVKVKIEAGKTVNIRRTLEPAGKPPMGPFGELITEGFGNAAVYLDGKYHGNTIEFGTPGQSLLLKPATYSMKIVPVSGGSAREEKIVINADEALVLSKTGATVRRK
ncbi:MAG: PEGA domain-containing protein [bacterium]|nr:PEGA domain-containing protein [bacterium]